MKTYDEMTKYVLEVRDEHEKKRKRRIYIAKRAVPAAAGILGAFVIGLGVWRNYKRPDTFPTPGTVVESQTETTAVTAQTTQKAVTTKVTTSAVISSAEANTTATTTAAAPAAETALTAKAVTTAKKLETAPPQTTSDNAAETTASATGRVTTTTVIQTATRTTTEPEITGNPPAKSSDPPGGYTPPGGGTQPSTHDPWYDMTIYRQYYNAFLDGYVAVLKPIYRGGYPISSELIGKHISSADMKSQYYVDGEVKSCKAEAYFINGFSDDDIVAIKFDGHDEYYLYHTDKTDLYSLMKQIPPLET
ncbi:hypothetical protein [Ruminococcus sp.]|uniref:hypothetical protein n=1 Tax=Ruminococcus sp. TaxID=41978 RepID=UPI0025DA113C|nr:hypothetical protein [Ruminococcus sp.]MCR4638783.1 hypothetical protein [Ruminococcus sp.]